MSRKIQEFLVKKHKWNREVDYGEEMLHLVKQPGSLTLLDALTQAATQNDLSRFVNILNQHYVYPGLVKRKFQYLEKNGEVTRLHYEYYETRPLLQALLCIRPNDLCQLVRELDLKKQNLFLQAIDEKIRQDGVPTEALSQWDAKTHANVTILLNTLRQSRLTPVNHMPDYTRKQFQYRLFCRHDVASRHAECDAAYRSPARP